MRTTDILLRDRGIKPSYQRKRIYKFLLEHRIHPTVNDIYEALILDIPTLSKATVYNTLNLFQECGLIDILPMEGNEARFDIRPAHPHAHFRCEICQKVFDVEIDFPRKALEKALRGSRITTRYVSFSGICADCCREDPDL